MITYFWYKTKLTKLCNVNKTYLLFISSLLLKNKNKK